METTDGRALELVSYVYHEIAQPLTALRCSLDLAMRRPMDAAGYRRAIEEAISAHERVVQAVNDARQVAEASVQGVLHRCDISQLILELVEDFEPVAETKDVTLALRVETGLHAKCEEKKLRTLLFLLLDALVYQSPRRALTVTAIQRGLDVEVEFKCDGRWPNGGEDETSLLKVALLNSLRGKIRQETAEECSSLTLSIPT